MVDLQQSVCLILSLQPLERYVYNDWLLINMQVIIVIKDYKCFIHNHHWYIILSYYSARHIMATVEIVYFLTVASLV